MNTDAFILEGQGLVDLVNGLHPEHPDLDSLLENREIKYSDRDFFADIVLDNILFFIEKDPEEIIANLYTESWFEFLEHCYSECLELINTERIRTKHTHGDVAAQVLDEEIRQNSHIKNEEKVRWLASKFGIGSILNISKAQQRFAEFFAPHMNISESIFSVGASKIQLVVSQASVCNQLFLCFYQERLYLFDCISDFKILNEAVPRPEDEIIYDAQVQKVNIIEVSEFSRHKFLSHRVIVSDYYLSSHISYGFYRWMVFVQGIIRQEQYLSSTRRYEYGFLAYLARSIRVNIYDIYLLYHVEDISTSNIFTSLMRFCSIKYKEGDLEGNLVFFLQKGHEKLIAISEKLKIYSSFSMIKRSALNFMHLCPNVEEYQQELGALDITDLTLGLPCLSYGRRFIIKLSEADSSFNRQCGIRDIRVQSALIYLNENLYEILKPLESSSEFAIEMAILTHPLPQEGDACLLDFWGQQYSHRIKTTPLEEMVVDLQEGHRNIVREHDPFLRWINRRKIDNSYNGDLFVYKHNFRILQKVGVLPRKPLIQRLILPLEVEAFVLRQDNATQYLPKNLQINIEVRQPHWLYSKVVAAENSREQIFRDFRREEFSVFITADEGGVAGILHEMVRNPDYIRKCRRLFRKQSPDLYHSMRTIHAVRLDVTLNPESFHRIETELSDFLFDGTGLLKYRESEISMYNSALAYYKEIFVQRHSQELEFVSINMLDCFFDNNPAPILSVQRKTPQSMYIRTINGVLFRINLITSIEVRDCNYFVNEKNVTNISTPPDTVKIMEVLRWVDDRSVMGWKVEGVYMYGAIKFQFRHGIWELARFLAAIKEREQKIAPGGEIIQIIDYLLRKMGIIKLYKELGGDLYTATLSPLAMYTGVLNLKFNHGSIMEILQQRGIYDATQEFIFGKVQSSYEMLMEKTPRYSEDHERHMREYQYIQKLRCMRSFPSLYIGVNEGFALNICDLDMEGVVSEMRSKSSVEELFDYLGTIIPVKVLTKIVMSKIRNVDIQKFSFSLLDCVGSFFGVLAMSEGGRDAEGVVATMNKFIREQPFPLLLYAMQLIALKSVALHNGGGGGAYLVESSDFSMRLNTLVDLLVNGSGGDSSALRWGGKEIVSSVVGRFQYFALEKMIPLFDLYILYMIVTTEEICVSNTELNFCLGGREQIVVETAEIKITVLEFFMREMNELNVWNRFGHQKRFYMRNTVDALIRYYESLQT